MVRALFVWNLMNLLGEVGVIPPLLDIGSGDSESKELALYALIKLSGWRENKKCVVASGGVPLLLKNIFRSIYARYITAKNALESLKNLLQTAIYFGIVESPGFWVNQMRNPGDFNGIEYTLNCFLCRWLSKWIRYWYALIYASHFCCSWEWTRLGLNYTWQLGSSWISADYLVLVKKLANCCI